MRFIPGEENWNGPSEKEMAFVAPTEEKIPETKKTRDSFKEINVIDNSKDGEMGVLETIRQMNEIEKITGLKVTSYKKGPNDTLLVMFEKLHDIDHKSGWGYSELEKKQAS